MATNSTSAQRDHDDPPADPVDQQLVAYLDGELEEAERMALEEQLLADDQLRNRLAELQSGWEMLDLLPPATVTEDFARTTVEMVAASESQMLEVQSSQRHFRRALRWGGLLVATVLAGLLGSALPGLSERLSLQRQLDDLPLAAHLDAYLVDLDLEMAERLAANPDWEDAMRLGRNTGGLSVPDVPDLAAGGFSERVRRVSATDNETRGWLSGNWDRLQSLPASRIASVRQRAAEIAGSQDPQRLLATLEEFAVWYGQLNPEAQTRIVRADSEQKLEVIQRELQSSQQRWIRDFGSSFTEADRELVYERLLALAEERIETARADLYRLPGDPRENRREARWYEIRPFELLHFIASPWRGQSRSRDRDRESDSSAGPSPESEEDIRDRLFGQWRDDELEAVLEIMSQQAKIVLNAQASDVGDQRRTLIQWCREVIQQMSPYAVNNEMLFKRYERYLDSDERESLDLLAPGEMFDRLRGRRWGSPGSPSRGND